MGYRGGGVALVWDGHILLGKRLFNPEKGYFSIPGGGANEGETLSTAAFRELAEETGIRIPKANIMRSEKVVISLPFFNWETDILYLSKKPSPPKGRKGLYPEFVRNTLKWYPLSMLPEMKLAFGMGEVVRRLGSKKTS
jgi:ADP-ribose pyrophosphatase YjhB (NUDIX family)